MTLDVGMVRLWYHENEEDEKGTFISVLRAFSDIFCKTQDVFAPDFL
jgi:hypothetical protein